MKRIDKFNELTPEQLAWRADLDKIPFDTIDESKVCDDIIGQERALKAIQVGLEIKSSGYNIFVTGMVGTGRTTTIKQLLECLEKGEKRPDDILYVNNFKIPDEPIVMTLPAGQGRLFNDQIDRMIETLKTNIPNLLKNKYYTDHRDQIVETEQKHQKEILEGFQKEVAEDGFSVIQVQVGPYVKPDLVPLIEDKPTAFSKVESMVKAGKFSAEKLDELNKKYETLKVRLEKIFKQFQEVDERVQRLLKEWDEESITPIITEAINQVKFKFDIPDVFEYLKEVEKHLIDDLELFKRRHHLHQNSEELNETELKDPFLRYRVNLLIDNSELKGPPIIMETNPSYINVFGAIESSANRFGMWETDFTKIKAGSLLKANGGYLVMNAMDMLVEPGVWPTLKRALRNKALEIQNLSSLYVITAGRLKPESVAIDVKVVLIGDSNIYNFLYNADVDFKKVFKIKAEFDTEIIKSDKTLLDYIQFINKICLEDKLNPFDKDGMAAIVEYGTRLSGKQKKVSTRFNIIADVISEADYWAKKDGKNLTTRNHVETAIHERFERVSLVEDKIQEMIEDGTIMIDTDGSVVGQLNGLSVYQLDETAFGKPTRITASTSVGKVGVINIDRQADLSGPTHNKGVLILGGFLRGKYAQNKPFSLSASIAFEQSYSGVDGDSASSAEVYAILSSLSNLPLRQDIAVTGSLNQKGEIQPIGGVNYKIEGFYDVCKAKGLTGKQGVIIPPQNIQNLMLRADIVDAVAAGRFHVYPVRTIDEGISILTGVKAGEQFENGEFEDGTVNFMVDLELQRLAKSWQSFDKEKKDEKDEE